ncbi:MAG: Protein phosphatase 2C 2 [Chrysothrix sp. TS-e1954]|nr:MAG: Protein phosphatase 2C 2 [Chrysothrix sp. TS-e1954]
MGQTLSEPVIEKTSDKGQDDRVAFGVSAMQGWRISMEDAHACVLDLKPESEDGTPQTDSKTRISYFGVYDGHGGDKVALYTGQNLHKIVAKQDAFKDNNFEQALKDGFLACDRAILSAEKSRICAAGGFVDFGRVNGNLALSRAIGDFEFKKSADLPPESQIVTAFPDVSVHEVSDDDEFLVIACDGIWDCQSSQAVVEFVRRGIVAKQELQAISENMMDNCLASNSETGGVGCDNMTMAVIALLKGKTQEEWYAQVADRVAKGDGPCAPPEYAEFRGPGIHHVEDSPDDYDMDMDSRTRDLGGRSGRIILLGDGTEVLTDSADSDMFDHDEEDKDLESQVDKGQANARSEREGTPGPTSASDSVDTPEKLTNSNSSSAGGSDVSQPSSESETKIKAASDTPLSSHDEKELLEK